MNINVQQVSSDGEYVKVNLTIDFGGRWWWAYTQMMTYAEWEAFKKDLPKADTATIRYQETKKYQKERNEAK